MNQQLQPGDEHSHTCKPARTRTQPWSTMSEGLYGWCLWLVNRITNNRNRILENVSTAINTLTHAMGLPPLHHFPLSAPSTPLFHSVLLNSLCTTPCPPPPFLSKRIWVASTQGGSYPSPFFILSVPCSPPLSVETLNITSSHLPKHFSQLRRS